MNNFISHIYIFIFLYSKISTILSSFIDLCFMNRESRSENEEARKASKSLLPYDQNIFTGMTNSRNYHFGIQKTESTLIIFISSVEELSISYNKFYNTSQTLLLALLIKLVFSSRIKYIFLIFQFMLILSTALYGF